MHMCRVPYFFLTCDDGGSKRDRTWSNEPKINQFFDGSLNTILQYIRVLVRIKFNTINPYFQFNRMLNPMVWWPTMRKVPKHLLMIMK